MDTHHHFRNSMIVQKANGWDWKAGQISPMIWRRLPVRSDSSIADLHYTLQIAFGWSNEHLNRFRIHGQDYGVYHNGGVSFTKNPKLVRLSDFKFRKNERFHLRI